MGLFNFLENKANDRNAKRRAEEAKQTRDEKLKEADKLGLNAAKSIIKKEYKDEILKIHTEHQEQKDLNDMTSKPHKPQFKFKQTPKK